MDKTRLIQELQSEALGIIHRNEEKIHALKMRAKMIIGKVFTPTSHYLKELEAIHFNPSVYSRGIETIAFEDAWQRAKGEFINLCTTMIDDLTISALDEVTERVVTELAVGSKSTGNVNKVFVVHGHDNEMKEAVARALTNLGLEPIILHEQPDQGRTVIEKFEDHSDVGFAVVLLSGDNLTYPRLGEPKDARPCARQNVILELGFFLGKLGRGRVLPLYRRVLGFELPPDYEGVLYKGFDSAGGWKIELWKELKAAGYDVDANKMM